MGHLFERHDRSKTRQIPQEYCIDLDAEKIGDAVAYPSNALAIGLVRELDLAVELAKAYNNWAYDFCKSTGNRVNYAAVIAPQVVPEAVKEIRRAVTEKGAVGVMMPTYVQSGLDLGQPEFDSIYAASAGTECSRRFSRHRASCSRQHALSQISRCPHDVRTPSSRCFPSSPSYPTACSIAFPNSRSAFLEAGVGFLPYWMERFRRKISQEKIRNGTAQDAAERVHQD